MIQLTIELSQIELISGIPEYITFKTDVPSIVFYTLDGTVPESDSMVAEGRVYLPSNVGSVTVTAVAVSEDDNSDIVTETFSTLMQIDKVQNIRYEGIQILPSGSDYLVSLGFDEDGDPTQNSSIILDDLDIVASKTDYIGMPIEGQEDGKTTRDFINFIKDKTKISHPYKTTPNNNNVYFDPKSKYIEIDGTTTSAMESQIVKIVNRPYGNFDPVSKGYNEAMKQSENVISGNLVRSMYDPATGIYVSFYYESKDSRWIVSKQKTDKKIFVINFNSEKNKFVFRWVEDRHMTRIF
jgi:hypothetical protein